MILEWNEVKNRSNIRKHGLDFGDAEEMFRGVLVVKAGHARRLWRKALDRNRDDSGAYGYSSFYGTCPGNDSHHFLEEGAL
jgi:hypothetical protein